MRKRTFLLSALILAALGFLLGFFLFSRFLASDAAPPSMTEAPKAAVPPSDRSGWCCKAAGQRCVPDTSAQLCIGRGGKLFNKDRAECDDLCGLLGNMP